METDRANGPDGARYAHVDGEVVPADEAAVSVRDRGFRYGDAAVEILRAYGGVPFRWEARADRLADTCEALGMPLTDLGLSAIDLRARIGETLAANGLAEARLRLSITRGDAAGLTPPSAGETDPTVVVTATPLPRGGRADGRTWGDPATIQTAKTRRVPDRSVPRDAKTHAYLDAVLARAETRVTGADDAVLLDADGAVTGCAAATLFFVADDAIRTPADAYPGVTRETLLDLAREEGFPVETGRYAPDDVRAADEAFLASTVDEVRPVGSYDGVEIGGGPVTRLLSRLYDERVEAACYDPSDP